MAEILTPARLARLDAQIQVAARNARIIDPDSQGLISYSAMCGGMQSIFVSLIGEIAGRVAADQVNAAFEHAFDDDSEEARLVIAKATRKTA